MDCFRLFLYSVEMGSCHVAFCVCLAFLAQPCHSEIHPAVLGTSRLAPLTAERWFTMWVRRPVGPRSPDREAA